MSDQEWKSLSVCDPLEVTMTEDEKIMCDVCVREFDMVELAYFGSGNGSCSPFVKMDAICDDCFPEWKEKNESRFS
jgi:hypothetical protein